MASQWMLLSAERCDSKSATRSAGDLHLSTSLVRAALEGASTTEAHCLAG